MIEFVPKYVLIHVIRRNEVVEIAIFVTKVEIQMCKHHYTSVWVSLGRSGKKIISVITYT